MSDDIGRLPRCPVIGCRSYLPAGRQICTKCSPKVPAAIGLALIDVGEEWERADAAREEMAAYLRWAWRTLFALAVAEAGRVRMFRGSGDPHDACYWRYELNPKTWGVEIVSSARRASPE